MNETEAKELLKRSLRPGSLFEERYRIEKGVGHGSFSYVIKAWDEREDRAVAIKVLRPNLVEARPEVIGRFENETHIVANLAHRNTIRVLDSGVSEESLYYLVMEFVPGVLLQDVVEKRGALEPKHAVRVVRQVLASLDEAHGHSIVHRDMKPENVMICATGPDKGIAKVLDFGVAKLIVEGRPSQLGPSQQKSTQFIGTPIYMSPEQALGERVDRRTDVYAVGIMLYELVSGDSPPLHGDSVATIVRAHLDEGPLPFAEIKKVPLPLQQVIRKATARYKEDRYETARDFARAARVALDEFIALDSGEPTPMRPVDQGEFDDLNSGPSGFTGDFEELDAPEEWEEDWQPAEPTKDPRRRPRMRASEPRVAQPEIEPSLAVDIRPTERRDAADSGNHRRSGDPAAAERRRQLAWILSGVVALIVSFLVASCTFASGRGVLRLIIGLLPALAAILWTQFSSVRRSYGSFIGRWVEPTARQLVLVTVGLVVFVALVFPGEAANKLGSDAGWFLSDGAAKTLVEALGDLLAAFFRFAYRAAPW